MAGILITLEGIEGSGKTSQQRLLTDRLRREGRTCLALREPGGTPLSERVRALLLARPETGAAGVSPWAEASLMLAARAQLVEEVMAPALDGGQVVVCDRFADSTLAYQGFGRGLDLELLRALNRAVTRGRVPHLTLLFDLPVDDALARLGAGRAPGEMNRIDREPRAFHERVRAGFRALAEAEPERWAILDAARDPERVAALAWARVEPLLRR